MLEAFGQALVRETEAILACRKLINGADINNWRKIKLKLGVLFEKWVLPLVACLYENITMGTWMGI